MSDEKEYIRHGFGAVRPYLYLPAPGILRPQPFRLVWR